MGLFVYNGSSWSGQATGFKLYNGSSWSNITRGYVYDGSSWRQFYPETPANTVAPTISIPNSTTEIGQTISITTGTWTNNPTSYSYQWYYYPAFSGPWTSVSGATSSSWYVPALAAGAQIKCAVTATNARGSTTVEVNPAPGSYWSPARLTGLTASKTGTGTAFLSWNTTLGANRYYIQSSPPFAETTTTSTSITITGLTGPTAGFLVAGVTTNYGWSSIGLQGQGQNASLSGLP